MILRDDIFQKRLVNFQLVAPLLEGDAKHILVFHRRRAIGRVDLHDVVVPLALPLEHLERFRLIAGGNHAIGYLAGNELCRGHIAGLGESNPVAVGGHTIRAARTRIGISER